MANNLIQIKRSLNTATPASLANGEFAFTSNGDILYIGANGAIVPIAGKRVPGTLTANQALVANSTSGIDKIITANLTLSSFSVNTINAVANLTHLGAASNSELATSWAIKEFVDLKVAQASNPQGSNGQFQYNDSGVLAGTNNMIYNKTSGQITIGNSTVNVQVGYTGSINSLAHFHGNQNSYVQVVMQNNSNGTSASGDFVVQNDAGTETENYVDLGINSSTYNDPAFSAMGAGDSYLYAANNDLVIGTADAGDLKFITGGTTSGQIRAVIDASGNVGIGNTTPNAKLQVTGTANISGLTTITANLVLGTGLTANGGGGSAGQILKSGGTGSNVYWDTLSPSVAGSNTQIQFNDSNALAGDVGLVYNKTTQKLTVSNAAISGTTTSSNTTTGALTVAGGLGVAGRINTAELAAGNDSVYSSMNGTNISTANVFATGTVNGSVLSVGGWVIANQSGVFTSGVVNGDILQVGTAFKANTTRVTIGSGIGLSVNGSVGTAGQILYSNGTSSYWDAAPIGDITSVTAGNGLTGGNTSGDVTLDVGEGVGISVSGDSVAVKANNGIIANSTGTFVDANTFSGLIANSTGVHAKVSTTVILDGTGNLAVNAAALSFTDLTVSGNLTVLGDLVSMNVSTLAIEDPLIVLAKDQSNTTTYTDAVDIGFFGSYGNTQAANRKWTGLFRDQSDSGIYKLFDGAVPEPTTTVDTANVNFGFATLQGYLKTGGVGAEGLVSNSSTIAITANSTLNVAIVANTLSLATALPTTSGGTGLNSFATGDLLVGNTSNSLTRLASGTDGYVLQINGTGVVAWNTLDGGTF